jgi:hypothetical protein
MTMQPMNTFDPRRPCKVHDALNDCMVDWKPEWVGNYREYAEPCDAPGVIAGTDCCSMGGRNQTRQLRRSPCSLATLKRTRMA